MHGGDSDVPVGANSGFVPLVLFLPSRKASEREYVQSDESLEAAGMLNPIRD